MAKASLRQLSRQFARKVIDKSEYRRRRAELIDEVIAARGDTDQSTGPTTGTPNDEDDTQTDRNDGASSRG